MARYPRLILRFAAATGITAVLATGAPAMAADMSANPGEPARKAASSTIKRHVWRATRTASFHDTDRADAVHGLGCSGVWCGRQFVLIVGVAY